MNVQRLYAMSCVERIRALDAMTLAQATAYQAEIEKLVNELLFKPEKTTDEREMLDFYCEDGAWQAKRTVREAQAKERPVARKAAYVQTVNLVKAALKDKAPKLYASLQATGKLNEYAVDLAEQIATEVVSLTMEQRQKQGWDKLGPMECAARMKTAASLNQESVLAALLEFPQDETSPPSQD